MYKKNFKLHPRQTDLNRSCRLPRSLIKKYFCRISKSLPDSLEPGLSRWYSYLDNLNFPTISATTPNIVTRNQVQCDPRWNPDRAQTSQSRTQVEQARSAIRIQVEQDLKTRIVWGWVESGQTLANQTQLIPTWYLKILVSHSIKVNLPLSYNEINNIVTKFQLKNC